MTDSHQWDEQARQDLRTQLCIEIRGRLRLGNDEHEEILDRCTDLIEEECPDDEQEVFQQFANDEFSLAETQIRTEQATWPTETDGDRLDRVEQVLLESGIIFWQVSPCCDSCTIAEFGERIAELEEDYPGIEAKARGYAFFIDQNMPELLAKNSQIELHVGFGWFPPDQTDSSKQRYEQEALSIAREVCETLRAENFVVNWNETLDHKIALSLNWQRRDLLR